MEFTMDDVRIYLSILMALLISASCSTACANPSCTTWGNGTHISMRIVASLRNRTMVELFLINNISSTSFKPESFKTEVDGSNLLVRYDARVSGYILEGMNAIDEGQVSRGDLAKYLQFLVLFAAGLAFLSFSIISLRKNEEELLKSMENGYVPPKGSRLSEDVLLSLASKNPDAYRRILDMVLKGELKVERRGCFKKMLQKAKKFVHSIKSR